MPSRRSTATISSMRIGTIDLNKRYDAIIMADVIEHVEQPPRALKICKASDRRRHHTWLLDEATPVTVRALLNRGPHVYWDDMALFAPEHIQAMCDRHSLKLRAVHFYTAIDERNSAACGRDRADRA